MLLEQSESVGLVASMVGSARYLPDKVCSAWALDAWIHRVSYVDVWACFDVHRRAVSFPGNEFSIVERFE